MMENKKRNFVEWAMHYRQIIILLTCCLMAFGIYSLPQMRKNEFPDFTIRQGMVVAVAPGNSAREMAEQVAKPLEEYIFSYKEVKKEKTFSQSRDGIVYIQVQLNDDINDKDAFWSKFKHGVVTFKSQLPDNVLALQVLDDFGDTSALLIAMESDDKTYRELNEYMDRLQDRLRLIPSVGRMTVSGMQKEQISVYVDNARLTKYGLSDRMLAAKLMQKGFATSGGRLQTDVQVQPVYVARSLNAVRDVEQMVVYADPKGNIVRLKDVARVAREYPKADSYITYNGKKCLLLSVEMKKGQDIVKMGNDVNRATEEFRSELPSDVGIYRITDQSRVVSDSVATFLRELGHSHRGCRHSGNAAAAAKGGAGGRLDHTHHHIHIAGPALLFQLRAEHGDAGRARADARHDCRQLYRHHRQLPREDWRGHVALACLDREHHPFLQVHTLGNARNKHHFLPVPLHNDGNDTRLPAHFPVGHHRRAGRVAAGCHAARAVLAVLVHTQANAAQAEVVLGARPAAAPLQPAHRLLLPLAKGHGGRRTGHRRCRHHAHRHIATADDAHGRPQPVCRGDIPAVGGGHRTHGKGGRQPGAHTATRPARGVGGIVQGMLFATVPKQLRPADRRNQLRTVHCEHHGGDETIELLDEYTPRYHAAFPDALVRFKQLGYSEAVYPVEFRLSGNDWDSLRTDAGKLLAMMRAMPELTLAHSDNDEPLPTAMVKLKEDEAARLGVSNTTVETTLALRYGDGLPVAKVWNGDYDQNVVIKGEHADSALPRDLGNEPIPVAGGLGDVPLRQVATVTPA